MADWPLNELLCAYLALWRRRAADEYRSAMQVWAASLNPFSKQKPKPPAMPAILKELPHGDT